MKRSCYVGIAVLFLSLAGCKPDAAVERGSVINAGPATSEKDVRKPGTEIVTEPKTDKTAPLKQVQ